MYNLILTAVLITAFFMCIGAFILGFKVCKSIYEGKVPTVKLNPVKTIVDAYHEHKQTKEDEKAMSEIEEVMNVSADTMLKSIKEGVK